MTRRILVLGATGLGKAAICRKLKAYGILQNVSVGVHDFELDCLQDPKLRHIKSFSSHLSQDVYVQAHAWHAAWPDFRKKVTSDQSGVVIVCLHGTLVRHFYGVRMCADVNAICDGISPDLVVTLVDDVYSMWWRTEGRADGDIHTGRPTLEQLLMARRNEALVGDSVVATLLSVHKKFSHHITLAINHPVQTLANIVFDNATVVYLSFPISAPRRALAKGDASLVARINDLHRRADDYQKSNHAVAFVSPLAVDELPFVEATKACVPTTPVRFSAAARWALEDLWGNSPILSDPVAPRDVPYEDAENVRGLIRTDVGWRDNRLVLQAKCLAVYSPSMNVNPPHALARGVREEIDRAVGSGIRCFVYQPEELDPGHKWNEYHGEKGSMGDGPGHEYIRVAQSLSELFDLVGKIK